MGQIGLQDELCLFKVYKGCHREAHEDLLFQKTCRDKRENQFCFHYFYCFDCLLLLLLLVHLDCRRFKILWGLNLFNNLLALTRIRPYQILDCEEWINLSQRHWIDFHYKTTLLERDQLQLLEEYVGHFIFFNDFHILILILTNLSEWGSY